MLNAQRVTLLGPTAYPILEDKASAVTTQSLGTARWLAAPIVSRSADQSHSHGFNGRRLT
jgi:hypothetical protein